MPRKVAKRTTVADYIALAAERLSRAIAAATRSEEISDGLFKEMRQQLRGVLKLERRVRAPQRIRR